MRPYFTDLLGGLGGLALLVPDYAVMMAAAILVGLHVTLTRAEAAGIDARRVFVAALVTVVGGVLASRLLILVIEAEYYREHPAQILQFWRGGLTSFGALFGGGIVAVAVLRWQRLPLARTFDCCAPALALVVALMRGGCFLNGCCFGRLSDLPWAVSFPEGSAAAAAHAHAGFVGFGEASLAVHPVQLYAVLVGLGMFAVLRIVERRKEREGDVLAAFIVLYAVGRFFLEFVRGDERDMLLALSLPQVFCLVALAGGLAFFLTRWVSGRAAVEAVFRAR
jgi:phosphatidylglycerol:prolipoprotein diacylglycerol transferase